MTDAATLLQQLGFSDYEARAYIALLQRSPLNGYELAKLSGLPRANIYAVLQKLADRSAVMRLDTPSGPRYAPVPPQELTQRLGDRFQTLVETAHGALTALAGPGDYSAVWNVRDYPVVLEHARTVVGSAQERLLIALTPQEAGGLTHDLAQSEERGVAVTTLCMAACATECGHCRGQIYRYQVVPEQRSRWLVLVVDDREAMAGEIGADEAALAIRTHQRLLIDLLSWYIQQSIALAAVVDDLGERLDVILAPATRTLLHIMDRGQPRAGLPESLLSRNNGPLKPDGDP